MKFKKILAGAMAGAMVLGSVTGVSAATSVDDLTCEGWWTDFTEGFALTEGTELTITGTTTNTSTNNWNNMIFVLFSGDGTVNGTDYVEYFVGRSDDYGWGTATYEVTSYPDDWDTWLATTQAGAEFTLTATYTDGTITIVSSCEGAEYTVTYTVEDSSLSYYIALGGEVCTLSNLSATGTTTITLSDSEVGLMTGNSKTVSVTPAYAESTVASADESVANASVADDVVTITAVAAGSTTVTVTSGTSSQEIAVTVSDEAIALTAITASADNTALTVGGTATISVAKTPSDTTEDPTLTYASDDTDVLTVDESGVVTAVAAGSATVTVTTTNEAGDTLTSTVDFTVTEAASEEDSSSDESSEEASASESTTSSDNTDSEATSEDTESTSGEKTSGTTIQGTAVDDVICSTDDDGNTWWINHSASILLEDGATTTITFTNTTTGSSNWNTGIYVIYSGDEAFAGGSGISDLSGYTEYYVCRSDVYGWDGAGVISAATLTTDSAPADDDAWAEWLAACQAGQDCTITATLDGSTLTVVFTVGDAQTTAVITVDSESPVYLSLTGELCELTDIYYTVTKQVSGASASSDTLTSTTGDGKAAVYTVTADTINDASTDYFFVSVTDAAGSYITADVNGNCTYYSAVTGETITVDIYDGAAITLEEGVTYLVNVDRDDDTNSILISFWSEDGSTLLLSYLVEDTDLEDEITTSIVTSDTNTGSFSVTASLEDASYTSSSSTDDDGDSTGSDDTTDTDSTTGDDDTTGTGSTTTTKTTKTTTTTTGSADTGDASPIIPIAVAVLGCAAVVVASKKRMA